MRGNAPLKQRKMLELRRDLEDPPEATTQKHYARVIRKDCQRAATAWSEKSGGRAVDDGSRQKGSDRTAEKSGVEESPKEMGPDLIRGGLEKEKYPQRCLTRPTKNAPVGASAGSSGRCSQSI